MKTLTGKEILGCPNLFGRSALREVQLRGGHFN